MAAASGSLAFLGAARFQGFWDATNNWGTGSNHPEGAVTGAPTGSFTSLFTSGDSVDGGYNKAGSPAGVSITASLGDYWQVTVDGSTNVDGFASWRANDWIIYSGSTGTTAGRKWTKLAFEDTIASIVVGDLSASDLFHLTGSADKHVLFIAGTSDSDVVMSGSSGFTYDYTTSVLALTGSSKLGIGTASPDGSLHIIKASAGSVTVTGDQANGIIVEDDDSTAITLLDPSGGVIYFGDADDTDIGRIGYRHGGDYANSLYFTTNNAQQMTIDSAGKVGIGTATPAKTLDVSGDMGVSGSVTLGDASSDVTTVTSQLTASQGMLIADDSKLYFGTANESHIEYRESDDNYMVISGSAGGMVLSGTSVTVDGKLGIGSPTPSASLEIKSDDLASASAMLSEFNSSVSVGGHLILRHARGTMLSPAGSADGDSLGAVSFWGYNEDGDNFDAGAQIRCYVDGEPSTSTDDSDMPALLQFSTTPDGTAGTVARMTINAAGNIGIGTVTPAKTLDVSGDMGVSGSVTLGDASDDVTTVTSQLTASQGMLVDDEYLKIVDDTKILLGTNNDAYIEYRETDDNYLVISGSTAGLVVSGTSVVVDSAETLIQGGTSADAIKLVAAGVTALRMQSFQTAGTGTVYFNPEFKDVDYHFAGNSSAPASLSSAIFSMNGSTGVLTSSYGLTIKDNKKLYLGNDGDAHIEFSDMADGGDFLVVSGTAAGVVISGSSIVLDGTTTLSALKFNDNSKLYFGTDDDSYIEYTDNTDGADWMTISGSASGIALSGTTVTLPAGNLGIGTSTPEWPLAIANDGSGLCIAALTRYRNSAGDAPVIAMRRARGTIASPTNALDAHTLGTIVWYGYNEDGTDFDEAASIVVTVDGTPGDSGSDMPAKMTFRTTPDGAALDVARMTINAAGNIGIGTETPAKTLDVSGDMGVSGSVTLGDTSSDVTTVTSQLTASQGITTSEESYFNDHVKVADDKKLYLGTDNESYIEYRETDDNYMVISGSATGLVLSGSNIILDAESAALGVAASAGSKLHIEHADTTTWATDGATNNVNYDDFLLTLRNNTDTQHAFAGIAFDVTSETDPNSMGAGILAVADNATSTAHDTNLIFATNDAGDAALRERMRITHDGSVGIGEFAGPEYKLDVRSDDTVPGKEQAQLGLSTYADTSTYESALVFRRARGAIGSPTVVADGDALGSIKWEGYNDDSPAGFEFGARIAVEVDGTPSSSDASDMPAKMVFGVASDGSSAATTRLTIDSTGLATFTGNVYPSDNNTQDLGGINNRWANLYTGDLHLKNERGDWTIVEEEDYLCVVNNKSGKKYKMMLQEIED